MSLEELLKDADGSSAWQGQRGKLIRVIAGISILTLALVGGTAALLSLHRHGLQKSQISAKSGEPSGDAKTLAELMRLQKEAKSLKEDLAQVRAPSAISNVPTQADGRFRARSPAASQIVSYDPGDGFAALGSEKRDLYIPTGAVFQARLLTPIKTSLDKTFVMAETMNEFRMDMKRRIPRGSRLIGRSRLDPILKGVVVEFDTLVTPNGIESQLSALALSRNALPEIDGLFFSDKLLTYGTALAFGFLSGFSDAAREREVTVLGSQPSVSIGNQVLTGLSTASFQVANQMLEDIRASAIEYVVVPAGEQVFVVLTHRYDLTQGGPK